MSAYPEYDNPQHAHLVHPKIYFATLVALVVLMLATVFASQIQFPGGTVVNNVIAMTIAIIKAGLVVAIFMGVKYGTNLTKLFAALGFAWFLLMFMTFADYATRKWEPAGSWDRGDTGSAMPRVMGQEPMGEKDPNMVNVRPR